MGTIATRSIGESKQLLADEVFHHLGGQIIEGVLAPEQRIRDIDVAEELHVSRTPVREALQRLERLGMVTMYPSRYTEVTVVTPEVVAQSLEFAGYQAGITARMAVPRMTQHQRVHVAELVQPMLDATECMQRTEAAWAVYDYLAKHCGNAQQQALLGDAAIALIRNLRDWQAPNEDTSRMNQVLLDFRAAILRGDGDAAERLTRAMHYV